MIGQPWVSMLVGAVTPRQKTAFASGGLKVIAAAIDAMLRQAKRNRRTILLRRALRIGLVDRVEPDAELWDATMEIAHTISGNAPLAIKAAKITIAQVLKDPDARDMAAIRQIGIDCMDSEDFREGRQAFMGKRKPLFKGR